jgi:hypothetical protein
VTHHCKGLGEGPLLHQQATTRTGIDFAAGVPLVRS